MNAVIRDAHICGDVAQSGRASRSQREGRGFDSPRLHFLIKRCFEYTNSFIPSKILGVRKFCVPV